MADNPKISGMTASVVGDHTATTSALESSINITTTPATRQVTFGVVATWLRQTGFATAVTAVSPAAVGWGFTNASGTDNAAGNVTITAPLSTGAATPASIIFNVGVAHGSDAVLQTATTAATLTATSMTLPGALAIGGALSGVTTLSASSDINAANNINVTTSTAALRLKGSIGVFSAINVSGADVMQFNPTEGGVKMSLSATAFSVVPAATFSSSLAVTGALTANAGITNLVAGTSIVQTQSSVNGATVLFTTVGKNSAGVARTARIGLNAFADDVWSFDNGTTEYLRVHLTTGAFTVTGAATFSSTLAVTGGFGCNGATPQAKTTLNAASTDLASVIALCNQIRTTIIANGQSQ